MYRAGCMLWDAVKSAFGRYLKAQLLIALTAFALMFPALFIYGQKYAFLIALFLAFLDFLPLLGTSALLTPWGIIEIVRGDIVKGLFLFSLTGSFFFVRRFMEPKIVGSQSELHPLVALLSIAVGIKLSGLWGAILGPIAMMIVVSLIKAHIFDNTVKDIRAAFDDIAGLLRPKGGS